MTDDQSFSIIRHPAMEDAPDVLEFMALCETHEFSEPDSDIEDLEYDWNQIDLNTDAWLAFNVDKTLVGYTALLPWGNDKRLDYYLHPDMTGKDASYELLNLPLDRIKEIAFSTQSPMTLISFTAAVNRRDIQTLESTGFEPVRYHFQMRMDMQAPPQSPKWPSGVAPTIFDPERKQDLHAIHALIQTAFTKPGRNPQSFTDWQHTMTREDIFEPALWFLAIHEERIVGACLCYNYSGLGWVRQLAVDEDWRRQGLGSALLLHSFNVFWQRGLDKVGLGVAADNADAYAFYQRLGMYVKRQYCEYRRSIKNV